MFAVRVIAALILATMTSACLGTISNTKDQHADGTYVLSNARLSPMTHQYTIFFELNSARLSSAAKATISEILSDALALKKGHLDDVTISVIGYGDRAGSDSHNLALSQKRAEAVRDALLEAGIPSIAITIGHLGEYEGGLVVSTPDGVAAPANRRVEVLMK